MELTKVDLWSKENLDDPWPVYKQLRDAAPATYMERYDIWAVPRYADVRAALGDWSHCSSEQGMTLVKEHDEMMGPSILDSVPPRHDELSKVFREKLSPGALREVTALIEERAEEFVAGCVEKGEFDAIKDIAHRFPVEVVADLVGLPKEGREGLMERASATFDLFGPDDERWRTESRPGYEAMLDYIVTTSAREKLEPGGFGMAIYEAYDAGHVAEADLVNMVATYSTAGIDTTVNGVGSLIWKLAENPDQWQLLRERPELCRGAFDEALRLEAPVMGFTRTVTKDYDFDGVTIPAGSKILPLLRSANRDERRWGDNANEFDITRDASGQLAFGFGLHACTGRQLAHLESLAVLKSMLARIETMEIVGPPSVAPHNIIRGLETLPLKVEQVRARAGVAA